MTGCSPSPLGRRRFLGLLGGGAVVSAVAGPLWWAPARAGGRAWIARAWRLMGTVIEVQVGGLPESALVEAVRAVRTRLRALENQLTLYDASSPLVGLNQAPPGRWVPVPGELTAAVGAAVDACRRSAGAFDPTVAPAIRAWGLDRLEPIAIDKDALRAWRRRAGVDAVEVESGRLRRWDRRVEVDLGGIGKGIAVDQALATLKAAGASGALVNLGGSIGVFGAPPGGGRGWPIGITHPRRRGEVGATLELVGGHLATSGDAERAMTTPQGRIHHLLDPATGEPLTGIASVTVRAATGVQADVMSTAAFVARGRGAPLPGGADVVFECRG